MRRSETLRGLTRNDSHNFRHYAIQPTQTGHLRTPTMLGVVVKEHKMIVANMHDIIFNLYKEF